MKKTGLQIKNSQIPKQIIDLKILPSSDVYGSYELVTFERQVAITAADTAGLFNGLVTLLQLYKSASLLNDKIVLPHAVIHDHPRFGWRGFMLDESRHFFGKQTVKELLDWMAFYKLNRFPLALKRFAGLAAGNKKISIIDFCRWQREFYRFAGRCNVLYPGRHP